MTPPRGLEPTGILLVDKPAGPSSFAIVAEVRRRTGARTGHAGTLDPFATGLLLLLSGRATKLAGSFVGLDKRYLTDVDLASRTTTGDPEGDELERSEPPSAGEELVVITRLGRKFVYSRLRSQMPSARSPTSANEYSPALFTATAM